MNTLACETIRPRCKFPKLISLRSTAFTRIWLGTTLLLVLVDFCAFVSAFSCSLFSGGLDRIARTSHPGWHNAAPLAWTNANRQRTPRTSQFHLLSTSNVNELIPLRRGSTVALITPMKPADDGSLLVDMIGLRRLLQYHLESGTDNLCLLGTTGEASALAMTERAKVIQLAVEECKGRIPLLIGTGTIAPTSVMAMTQQARDLGADAALVVTPYYVKPPQRCLIQHFTDIANYPDGLPIVMYNVPSRTGVNLLDTTTALLAQHDNIVGVKDATGDISRVTNLIQLLEANQVDTRQFLLWSGDDCTSADFCLAGGDGCISVTANVAASAMRQLMETSLAGMSHEAHEQDKALQGLHNDLFVESNPIPVKWAAYRIGLIETPLCRRPLDQMDPIFVNKVEAALRQAGLLVDAPAKH